MLESSSPIYHFYPLNFSLDSEGKRQDWEAVVVLEFVDEKLLKQAESSIPREALTKEELLRNQFGSILHYTFYPGYVPDPLERLHKITTWHDNLISPWRGLVPA